MSQGTPMTSAIPRRAIASAAICAVIFPRLRARAQAPAAAGPSASDAMPVRVRNALAALEARNGGRLGVAALDIGSERGGGYRADERFAMCSTHKFLTAAAILTMVDQ